MLNARAAAALLTAVLLLVTPAADAPGSGPVPVQWRTTWSAPADAEADAEDRDYEIPLYGASAQALAMAAGEDTVRIHDARTGALIRTFTTSGATVDGVWVAAGTVVVLTESQKGTGRLLRAYDVLTGAALWQHAVDLADEGDESGADSYGGPRIMVTERGVVLAERQSEPLTLLSLDLRSGRTLASTVYERHCDLVAGAGSRSVLLLDHCAGNRVRLASVDPATLRPAWTRTLPSPPHSYPEQAGDRPLLDLTVSGDGYVQVTTDDYAAFHAPDGRRLSTLEESLTPADPVRGGRWTEPMYLGGLPAEVLNGRYVNVAEWPLPMFLTSLDPVTGHLRALPLDMPSGDASLVGTVEDLAFVQSGGRVTAYALTYGAATGRELFGDVARDAWPDACGLLSAADLRFQADGYVPRPVKRSLLGWPLPKPVQCDWIPSADDAPVISVSVDWVAHSDAAARRMFAAETTRIKQGPPYDPVTEDPYLLDYFRTPASSTGTAPQAVIGVGPVIVRLASPSRPALRFLAPVLRDKLLARHGLPRPRPVPLPRVRWSFPTDGELWNAPMVTDGIVYASGGGRVYALDAASGRPRWARTIGNKIAHLLQVVDGQVYISEAGDLHVLDARTGAAKWRYQDGWIDGLTVAEGLVVSCPGERAVALDAASGRRLWRTGERGCGHPAIDGGAVYVQPGDGTVSVLDAATGHRRWSARSDAAVTAAGKVVYVGTGSRVRALDAASGAERWSAPIGHGLVSAPELIGTALYARDSAGTLHALDARTGKERWTFPTGSTDSDTRVTISGNLLYLAGPGSVHALDTASGAQRWSTSLGSDVVSGPVAHAGIVYAGADDTVHALDGVTGAPRWRVHTGSEPAIGPVVGGLVYAGGSGNVYALSPAYPPGAGG
ncbi:PQQ-binding-like beta-propeller repeat protein [Spongiactinospora sp. 9N601]|uniref:outer membrane protein assembly factor BamB family protein n=1 Tax=Spongiactinospora sp. 9N601 TaxID=3375149 RepID=UPI0037928038